MALQQRESAILCSVVQGTFAQGATYIRLGGHYVGHRPTFWFLWPPDGIGQAIIFLPCGFFLSSFFLLFIPRLISAVAEWMSTILLDMVWP